MKSIRLLLGLAGPVVLAALASPSAALAQGGAAAGAWVAPTGHSRADVRIDTIATRHIGLFAPDEAAHETVRSVTELAVGGAPSTPREARADRADPRASSGGGLRSTRR